MGALPIIPTWLDQLDYGAQMPVSEQLRETGMVLGELAVNPEGVLSMNADKAGQ